MEESVSNLTLTDLIPYLHKKIEVKLIDGSCRCGCVYTIDPESLSVMLFDNDQGDQFQMKLIMGHAITRISAIDDEDYTQLADQFEQVLKVDTGQVISYDSQAMKERKDRLINWLNQTRIPFEESGDNLCVVGVVTIKPPFDKDSCVSSNEIALYRVQNLIQNFVDNENKTK